MVEHSTVRIEYRACPDMLDEIPEVGGVLHLASRPPDLKILATMEPGDILVIVHRDGSGPTGVKFDVEDDGTVRRTR